MCNRDEHDWIFSSPGHIRCTKCPAIGQRWLSKEERAEFKLGRWIYIGRRYAKAG